MARDLNYTFANDVLDYMYDIKLPAGSLCYIRSGAPAGAENTAGGTQLSLITTPAGPWSPAAAGSKSKAGVWSQVAATATGTAGHYRITNAAGTYLEEGLITITGGGGDMTTDSLSITAGQTVTINTFVRTA